MPKNENPEYKKTILNYSLNVSILLLVAVCGYLLFSLISNSVSSRTNDTGKMEDTVKTTVTNQPNLTIQLDVRNGSGESGVASVFTEYLRLKGFDVVEIGNYTSSDEAKTLIIDRNGNKASCKKVAYSLGISERNIIQQINPSLYLDATVVIGKDYKELKPYLEKQKK